MRSRHDDNLSPSGRHWYPLQAGSSYLNKIKIPSTSKFTTPTSNGKYSGVVVSPQKKDNFF